MFTAFVALWCYSGASTQGIHVYSTCRILMIFRCLNSIRMPTGRACIKGAVPEWGMR